MDITISHEDLEELYAKEIPYMIKPPDKFHGEGVQIYWFGLESFRMGFLHGLCTALGRNEENNERSLV